MSRWPIAHPARIVGHTKKRRFSISFVEHRAFFAPLTISTLHSLSTLYCELVFVLIYLIFQFLMPILPLLPLQFRCSWLFPVSYVAGFILFRRLLFLVYEPIYSPIRLLWRLHIQSHQNHPRNIKVKAYIHEDELFCKKVLDQANI